MDQEGSNLQSTKKIKNNNNEDEDFFLKMELVKKTYGNAAMVYPMKPKLTTYSDQTG